MRPTRLPCAILLATVISTLAASTAPAQATLYDDLDGQPGIDRIVDNASARFLADPRIAQTFDDTNMDRFKRLLAAQLCQISDGPCAYHGRDMAAAHRGLALNHAQFNALAEDLQAAMAAEGVGYHTQNRLLARLAPMERDVVTR